MRFNLSIYFILFYFQLPTKADALYQQLQSVWQKSAFDIGMLEGIAKSRMQLVKRGWKVRLHFFLLYFFVIHSAFELFRIRVQM